MSFPDLLANGMIHDPMYQLIGKYRYDIEDRDYLLNKDIGDYRPGNIGTIHALMDAGLEYYRNGNMLDVSLPKICALSGFSRNVIYKYYKSVSDIMVAILNREIIALEIAIANTVTENYRNILVAAFKTNYSHLIWLVEGAQSESSNIKLKSLSILK